MSWIYSLAFISCYRSKIENVLDIEVFEHVEKTKDVRCQIYFLKVSFTI